MPDTLQKHSPMRMIPRLCSSFCLRRNVRLGAVVEAACARREGCPPWRDPALEWKTKWRARYGPEGDDEDRKDEPPLGLLDAAAARPSLVEC